VARCVASRIGRGGPPATVKPKDLRKFVVEFEGGPLERLAPGDEPEAVVTASRGEIVDSKAEPVPGTKRWRADIDLQEDGLEPVELRLFLRLGERPLTETWLYRHDPATTQPSE
jgi:glucans biosynthesis protein